MIYFLIILTINRETQYTINIDYLDCVLSYEITHTLSYSQNFGLTFIKCHLTSQPPIDLLSSLKDLSNPFYLSILYCLGPSFEILDEFHYRSLIQKVHSILS